jgi:hypothetical protein
MPAPSFGKLFAPSQLAAAVATIYTLPSGISSNFIGNGRVRFTNTDTVTHSVTAYLVPNAGSAGVANCFMNAETIAANSHLDVDLPQMGPGDFFAAFADTANKVTVHCLLGTVIS